MTYDTNTSIPGQLSYFFYCCEVYGTNKLVPPTFKGLKYLLPVLMLKLSGGVEAATLTHTRTLQLH